MFYLNAPIYAGERIYGSLQLRAVGCNCDQYSRKLCCLGIKGGSGLIINRSRDKKIDTLERKGHKVDVVSVLIFEFITTNLNYLNYITFFKTCY
jgi:hypothetical protein